MVSVEDLGNRSEMAGEVALGSLRNTSSTPCDQYVLRKATVGILDLGKGELNAPFTKVLNQIGEVAFCIHVSGLMG
jgi:hypothetical protein